MAVFANDWVGTQVNLCGYYEKQNLDTLFAFLAPLLPEFESGLALDVGANIGNHAVYFDKHFAVVHAFEPNPSTFQLLRHNATYSAHVIPHNYGLGSEAGEFRLHEELSNVGGASLLGGGKSELAGVAVRVARLDQLDIDLDGLCFIKIDVEGFEPHVLKGGAGIITRYTPLIILEQHAAAFGTAGDETEAIERLRELGYEIGWMRCVLDARPWLIRKLANVVELFRGKQVPTEIVFSDRVPVADYEMMIAVPPRFRRRLGLA